MCKIVESYTEEIKVWVAMLGSVGRSTNPLSFRWDESTFSIG